MKLLWLITLLGLSACSTNPLLTKVMTKTDYCLSDADSTQYMATHFSKPLDLEINKIDPSGASVLISTAINGRLGDDINAKSASNHLLTITHGSPTLTFHDIEEAVTALGYKATRHPSAILDEMRQFKTILALSTDQDGNLMMISGIENDVVYRVYPEGKTCLLDFPSFRQQHQAPVVMLIDKAS